jgi:hypothetical protein
MPARTNLKIYRGETFNHIFIWKDSDDVPIDLTGYGARMHIRKKIDDTDPVLTLSSDDGTIVITEAEGKLRLHLSSSVTEDIDWLEAVYDLEVYISDVEETEIVTRLVEGKVTSFKEVTR